MWSQRRFTILRGGNRRARPGRLVRAVAVWRSCRLCVMYQRINVDFGYCRATVTEACGMGHCPEEHQWVYFGIPYTVGQRRSLVQREARELCYEFGNCATAEVSLILGVITFPMASIGAIPSIILDVISVDAENGTPETVLGLTIDLAELSDIGGLVASILGSGIDVWSAGRDAASQGA